MSRQDAAPTAVNAGELAMRMLKMTDQPDVMQRGAAAPGDTIAIESPTFYGTLQTIEMLGMKALEIPTDPRVQPNRKSRAVRAQGTPRRTVNIRRLFRILALQPHCIARPSMPIEPAGFSIFILVLVFFAIVFVFSAVKMVPQGMEFTVERFGRYTRTLQPGLHIIVPIIDRVGRKLNMMEQVLDVPSQEVITKDNAMVTVDGVVFFQVLDAAKAAYEVSHLEHAVLNLIMTNIRTVMGSMDLDELLSQRDKINAQLLGVVDDATTPWGIKVTRIEIKDIAPPRDLVDSMARQMKAERDKRAAILEAEGLKQAAILKADGEKQAAILEAEGRKEAAFRDADARERLAEAEAKATLMVSQAIAKGDIQAVNYFVAQKYIDALQAVATSNNQKLVFMPLEAASVIGAIGGIAELARAGGKDAPPGRTPQKPV
jgi:regulator of protease activity HflC (stomatin/prohibitin superfamily)